MSLVKEIREAVAQLRSEQKIPTELRVSQQTYNAIRGETTFGTFGPTKRLLLDGLPCVISVGLSGPFRVRYVEVRE